MLKSAPSPIAPSLSADVVLERRIAEVVFAQNCRRHSVDKGEPCYEVASTMIPGAVYYGICNTRARKSGMVGKISPDSLRRSSHRGVKRGFK